MSRWLLLPLTAPLALAQGGPGVEGNWMGTLNAGALKTACGAEGRQSGRWVAFREIRQPRPGRQGSAGIDGPAKRLKVALELKMLAAAYDPYPYVEDEVVYENKAGAAKLAGTLTQPPGEGPFPAVLLITGSGRQDRDEALLGHRPFATTEDFAGDVLAGVEFLKTRGVHRIGLVGHSEGGIIAPMVAVLSKDVAFIVLMAGAGVTGEEVLHAQAAATARAAGANEERIARNSALQDQLNAIIKQESDPKVRESRVRELREKLKLPAGQQFTAAATPRRAAIATT